MDEIDVELAVSIHIRDRQAVAMIVMDGFAVLGPVSHRAMFKADAALLELVCFCLLSSRDRSVLLICPKGLMICLAPTTSAPNATREEHRIKSTATHPQARNGKLVLVVLVFIGVTELPGWSWLNRAEGKAEPDEMDAAGRRHHEPAGCPGVFNILIPAPAFEELVFAARRPDWIGDRCRRIRREPIGTPFPNVPVRVVQAPGIRTLQTDGMRRCVAVFRRPGELIGDAGIIAKIEPVGGTSPAGVFPLGFSREPIFKISRQASRLALAQGDGRAIIAGVEESNLLHREIGISGEVARVPSHDCRELTLCHLILPNPKVARDGDGKFDSHERPGFDGDHVGQGNQLVFGRDTGGVPGGFRIAPELTEQQRENNERSGRNP